MEAEIEAKASLARAYAAEEQPEFVSVAPDRRNEFWRLAGTLFLVPIIPPDAPDTLQYALRLHRGALFTGQCDSCAATIDVTEAVDVSNVAFAQSLIPHRRSCPAHTQTLVSQLRDHHELKASQSLYESVDAASARTREQVKNNLADNAIKITKASFHDWARGLLDEHGTKASSDCCDHLSSNPSQTWHLLLGQRTWRCDECWTYFNQRIRLGQWRLPEIEDHSCDKCRRFVPNSLEPLVLRIGIFVFHGGLCSPCGREGQQQSGSG